MTEKSAVPKFTPAKEQAQTDEILSAVERNVSFHHTYTSTACIHGRHWMCRKTCKFCGAKCGCPCHGKGVKPSPEEAK